MKFEPGQEVLYMRTRSGERLAEEIRCIYVAEVQFSHKERRHKVKLPNGEHRFVGLWAIIEPEDRCVWPPLSPVEMLRT